MSWYLRPGAAGWLLLLSSLSSAAGCAGKVNLGSDSSPPSEGAGAGGNGAASGSLAPETVRTFPANFWASDLVEAGDYLYMYGELAGSPGIFRCRKANCEASFARLIEPEDGVVHLQSAWPKLGYTSAHGGATRIGMYSLPDCNASQPVIDGVLDFSFRHPLFHGGFVYWFIDRDRSLYRCRQPDCADGPYQVAAVTSAAERVVAADSNIFWLSGDFSLFRARDWGEASPELLLPERELRSVSPADEQLDDPARLRVGAIAAADGMLYATIEELEQCEYPCPTRVVRWPAEGPGELSSVFISSEAIGEIFVSNGELVFNTLERNLSFPPHVTGLFSCRVEACAQTRRLLDPASAANLVVADDHYLYWLGAKRVPIEESGNEIRLFAMVTRALRLPPSE